MNRRGIQKKISGKNVAIILLFAVFLFLRLFRIDFHDFWFDEACSYLDAYDPAHTWQPPLYWILLHFWMKVFGISEVSLRLPSAVFSFLSVGVAFLLGKALFNRKVAIFASCLVGFSPLHLWYAQEARPYSMMLFLGLCATYLLFGALRKNKPLWWFLFVSVSICGLYTNYYYTVLFLFHLVCFMYIKRPTFKSKGTLYFLVAIFGFSFFLPRFISQFSYVGDGFWVPRPEWKALMITLENLMLGYGCFPLMYSIGNILLLLFILSAFISAYRNSTARRNLVSCLFLSIMPLISVFLFSRIFFSIYLDRAFIIFSPYLSIVLAFGIVSLPRRIKITSLSILFALLITGDYGYFNDWGFSSPDHHVGTYIKKPIKPLVSFLQEYIEEDDILAFTNKATMVPVFFYGDERLKDHHFFFDPEIPDSGWRRSTEESEFHVPLEGIASLAGKRLWVISSNWARDGTVDDNSQSVIDWLHKHYQLENITIIDGVWVLRYSYDKL